jgi:hypothetical protein
MVESPRLRIELSDGVVPQSESHLTAPEGTRYDLTCSARFGLPPRASILISSWVGLFSVIEFNVFEAPTKSLSNKVGVVFCTHARKSKAWELGRFTRTGLRVPTNPTDSLCLN